MSDSTALREEVEFYSLAPNSIEHWQWPRHVPQAGARSVGSETGDPPKEAHYQVVPVADCEEAMTPAWFSVQYPASATKSASILKRLWLTPTRPGNVGDLSSRTACSLKQEEPLSSTTPELRTTDVAKEVEAVFSAAKQEFLEDGVESELSKQLTLLIEQYGNAAVAVVSALVISGRVRGEVASVGLQTLGQIRHPPSNTRRLELLERALGRPSPWVRDGAALGLASLGNSAGIPYLAKAIEQEPFEELRRNMVAVLEYLERA